LGLFFDIVWVFPLAVFFISAGSKNMSTRFAYKGLLILSFLVLIVGIDQSSWVMAGPGINHTYPINKDGICIQSTSYTCGAASAVTLLHQYGIRTDEIEMARLSHTTRRGIKVTSLARGISRKVSLLVFKADIRRLDLDGLKKLGQPCIITTKFGFMVDHVVAFLGLAEDGVWIGDPLEGKVKWSEEKFLNKYRGIAIILSPTKESHHQDTKALRNNKISPCLCDLVVSIIGKDPTKGQRPGWGLLAGGGLKKNTNDTN
ncbi:unnamed protein product, partial [marine sediment metagenome]